MRRELNNVFLPTQIPPSTNRMPRIFGIPTPRSSEEVRKATLNDSLVDSLQLPYIGGNLQLIAKNQIHASKKSLLIEKLRKA